MEIFCIIYYVLSYISGIPAIVKLIKTKSSNDYSLSTTWLTVIGVTSWIIYIFNSKQSILVYIGTVIDEVLVLIQYGLVLRYFKKEK